MFSGGKSLFSGSETLRAGAYCYRYVSSSRKGEVKRETAVVRPGSSKRGRVNAVVSEVFPEEEEKIF
ncbi:MAG: hypothetical protein LBR08_03695 [Bacteroidales bacterium]|nr:hypothetical protein [Bacteroidales bacterium]